MLEFNKFKIKNTYIDGSTARIIELEVPDHLKDSYRYQAGQHITVKQKIDGQEERRSYSICRGEKNESLAIGVRKVKNGVMSNWLFDKINNNSELEVLPPTGKFGMANELNTHHWFFAAGSGITPIISILTTILERSESSRVSLFYSNKTLTSTMFVEELEDLKNKFLSRFELFFLFSQEEQYAEWENGRLTKKKLEKLQKLNLLDPHKEDHAYICGPGEMIEQTKQFLLSSRLGEKNIHCESFGVEQKQKASEAQRERGAQVVDDAKKGAKNDTKVAVKIHGKFSHLVMTDEDSLLSLGLKNELSLPYACKAGVCSTCRCQLVRGEVDMRDNQSLEDWELKKGIILSCQSLPRKDVREIEIDYDI